MFQSVSEIYLKEENKIRKACKRTVVPHNVAVDHLADIIEEQDKQNNRIAFRFGVAIGFLIGVVLCLG
jgi:hypothetical protein